MSGVKKMVKRATKACGKISKENVEYESMKSQTEDMQVEITEAI